MIAKHFVVWLDIRCIAMSLDWSKLATTCIMHDSNPVAQSTIFYPAASSSSS